MDALPYEQPPEPVLLPFAAFLLALHFVAYPLDKSFACGLLGQIVVGIVWGPVTSWLSLDVQRTVVQLGYIGLILLVYEGGLRTDLNLLRQTFGLSVAVATTGIILPIALSFVLLALFLPLQISALTAFTAGASLCSTSLGTTYAILSAAKLHSSKVGTVLVIAAMMDDVVGLVMVTVVSSLSTNVDNATTIIRPIFVSLAFLAGYVIGSKLLQMGIQRLSSQKLKALSGRYSFGIAGLVLLGAVAGAGYAGTSILFVGYLTGVSANYLFPRHAIASYELYFESLTNWLLVPFFFASMGFAIPVKALFSGDVVWRGLVYTVLMMLGKLATGIWLFLLPLLSQLSKKRGGTRHLLLSKSFTFSTAPTSESTTDAPRIQTSRTEATDMSPSQPSEPEKAPISRDRESQILRQAEKESDGLKYAVLLLSCAMTTRGEIGFLVSAIGQSVGVLVPEEVYLVVIWAIVLCTLLGPIGTGFIVRKIRTANEMGAVNVLGAWS